jgi:hypothetical protein
LNQEGKMALDNRREELNQVDEQSAVNRIEDERKRRATTRSEEKVVESGGVYPAGAVHREGNRRVDGHDFGRDMHPERYPRESLSRLEEGILEDDVLRHEHDHLGSSAPDRELRVDDTRNLSRLLMMLGVFLWVFAGVLLLWDGWDVRSGSTFFSTMTVIAIVLGGGLIVWGFVERSRVMRLVIPDARSMQGDIGQNRREPGHSESDRAA